VGRVSVFPNSAVTVSLHSPVIPGESIPNLENFPREIRQNPKSGRTRRMLGYPHDHIERGDPDG